MSGPNTQSRARKSASAEAQQLRQQAFLDAYEELCHISQAAEKAGIQRRTHYDWLAKDPEYAARFAESDRIAIKALEDEATRRALHGVDEPVFHQGVICGHVLKYSDRLMEFLLKGRDPGRYGDRFKAELTGKDGGAIKQETKIEVVVVDPQHAKNPG